MPMKGRFSHPHVYLALSHDIIMAILAYPLAFFIRLSDSFFRVELQSNEFLISWGLFAIVAIGIILLSDMHRGYWRYASFRDLRIIFQTTIFLTLAFVVIYFLVSRLEGFPRTLPFLLWASLFTLWIGPRALFRLWRDGNFGLNRWRARQQYFARIPVLLFGQVNEIESYLRHQLRNPQNPYHFVGIVTPSKGSSGRELHGVPILGDIETVQTLVSGHQLHPIPQRMIVALRSSDANQKWLASLTLFSERTMIPLSRLPGFDELKEGIDDSLIALPSIPIEDLLGRPQRALDQERLNKLIKDKIIMVTGAGGSIGAELCRQICSYQPRLLLLFELSEYALYLIDLELEETYQAIPRKTILGDVRDLSTIERLFETYRPELVFHAAAYKHVPLVEANPVEGVRTNVEGTKIIADMVERYDAKLMLQVSTDKAVRPSNIMGATKRLAEMLLQLKAIHSTDKTQTRFAIVRFGNVLGSTGSVIPLFERQLRRGGPLTVTHKEITRYFMTIKEAVQLILSAGTLAVEQPNGLDTDSLAGSVFILDMGKPIRIDDLARRMIRLAGFRPDAEIPIHYTGLRPGEKLYEELQYADENSVETELDGIAIVRPSIEEQQTFNAGYNELRKAIERQDEQATLDAIKQLLGNDFIGNKDQVDEK